MPKPTIIHIHTDPKFINSSHNIEGEEFENIIILIGSKGKYNGIHKNFIKYYDYSLNGFRKLISLCKTMNMVILYSLDFPKAYIANRLPKSVIVIWRFFGTELYSRIPEHVHSKKTKEILKFEERHHLNLWLKRIFSNYLGIIKYRAISTSEINKAIFIRTDFFLGLFRSEYLFLKSFWEDLPPFLQINLPPYSKANTLKKRKTNLVILGNNRRPYNNHLDILEGLKGKNINHLKFLLIFNYGSTGMYSEAVKKEANKIDEIKILEDFLSLKMFKELYAQADAFVLNGQRQMAMGNILEAFQNNVKIYLNKQNVIYPWLKESGFMVFTIDNFFSDIESNNLVLSEREILINQQQLIELTSKYNKTEFNKSLKEILKSFSE